MPFSDALRRFLGIGSESSGFGSGNDDHHVCLRRLEVRDEIIAALRQELARLRANAEQATSTVSEALSNEDSVARTSVGDYPELSMVSVDISEGRSAFMSSLSSGPRDAVFESFSAVPQAATPSLSHAAEVVRESIPMNVRRIRSN